MPDRFGTIDINASEQPSAPPPAAEPKRPRRPERKGAPRKKSRRSGLTAKALIVPAIVVALLFLVYCALGFWGVPAYFTRSLPKNLLRDSSLQMAIDQARFNPFTFELQLSGIRVTDTSDEALTADILTIASIDSVLAPLSLLRTDLVCTRLQVNDLLLKASRNAQGKYNFARFFTGGDDAQPSDIINFSELPFLFSLNNIAVTNSKVVFEDIPGKTTHTIEKIEIALPNLSNFPFQTNEYIHPKFSAVINGSPVELTGKAMLSGSGGKENLQTELACTIHALDVPRYLNYLPIQLPLTITKGKAEGILQLTFSPNGEDDKLKVDFTIEIAELELADTEQKLTIAIPTARIEGGVQPVTGDTRLKSVVLHKPTIRAIGQFPWHLTATLATIPPPAQDSAGVPITDRPPSLIVDDLLADAGTYALLDANGKKTLDRWESVLVNIKNYSRNVEQGQQSAEAGSFVVKADHADSKASMNFQGPFKTGAIRDGKLRFENLPTATLFDWLDLSKLAKAGGTVDLSTNLHLTDGDAQKKGESAFQYSDGSMTFHQLSLSEGKQVWLTSAAPEISEVAKNGTKITFAKIKLPDSAIQLQLDSLPKLFTEFSKADSPLSIKEIDLSGSLSLAKPSVQLPKLVFDKVSMQAKDLDSDRKQSDKDNLVISAKNSAGADIQAKGTVRLRPFTTSVRTDFSALEGPDLLPWFSSNPLVKALKADLSGKGIFTFPATGFNGELQIGKGGNYAKDKKTPYLSWDGIELQGIRYASAKTFISIAEMQLKAPALEVAVSAKQPSPYAELVAFLTANFPPAKAEGEKAAAAAQLEIQKISLQDGTLLYSDSRLKPTWKAQVSGLKGTISDFATTPAKLSKIALQGQIAASPFTLTGQVDLFSTETAGGLQFAASNLPLATFADQLKGNDDLAPDQGTFGLETTSSWEDGVISDQAQLIFTDLAPRSPLADSALPLALMLDPENKFTLALTDSREMTSPPAPLLTEALAAFEKIMIKANVSPLLVASGDFSDLVGNEFIEYLPGQTIMTGQGRETLTRFSALLSTHPHLSLTLVGSADQPIDGGAIKKQMEEAESLRVAKENTRRAEAWLQEREKRMIAVNEARRKKGLKPAPLEQTIPPELIATYGQVKPQPITVDATILKELAGDRANALLDFMIGELSLPLERIHISDKTRLNKNKDDKGNRVFFTLSAYEPPPPAETKPVPTKPEPAKP